MSIDIALTAGHDLTLSQDFNFVDGAERVKQQIKITLQTFLGEWFLDVNHGVPYFESVLVKQPNRAAIEAILRTKIKDVPDVSAVRSLQLSVDSKSRYLYVSGEAETKEGMVKFEFKV